MHWQCIDFLIDLLVLVPFELSDYVLFIAESVESGVLEWATSPYTKWIVLAFMCSGYCWRTIFSINNINTFFKTWLRFRKLEWLMISVGIMLICWQILLVERSWSERNVYFLNDCAQQRLRLCPCCRYSQGCSDIDCVEATGTCLCPKNNCHSNIFLSSTLLTMYCLISSSHFHSDSQKEAIAYQI